MNKLLIFFLILLCCKNNTHANWQEGAVVYQVFVDRFYNGNFQNDNKYKNRPYSLKKWTDKPVHGEELPDGYWQHDLDFWGGDLKGLTKKLGYIKKIGVDVLYISPIFKAKSNHKYDTLDYFEIDEGFGGHQDFIDLVEKARYLKIKIVLDGVFNHTSINSNWFNEFKNKKNGPYKNFYTWKDSKKKLPILWFHVPYLPVLNTAHRSVKDAIFKNENSIVKKYLKYAHGWRIDVANYLGLDFVNELTKEAHKKRKDSLIIAESRNYPKKWLKNSDGIINFYLRSLIIHLMQGKISANKFNEELKRFIKDSDYSKVLKSWTILGNHDTPRISSLLKSRKKIELATFLQFTIPGSPMIYYGDEFFFKGNNPIESRSPMQWKSTKDKNNLLLKLAKLREKSEVLKKGSFQTLSSEKLISFSRSLSKIKDHRIILANPSSKIVKEIIYLRESRLMANYLLKDKLSGKNIKIKDSFIEIELKPYERMILAPVFPVDDFSPYKKLK